MSIDPITKLSERQKEALRLYYQRLSTEEIAQVMGIKPNTVSGYLTEASIIVDAGGRPGAAQALTVFEMSHPKARGRFSVGDPSLLDITPLAHAEFGKSEARPVWSLLFPARRGDENNDLSIYRRLFPIPFIAASIAAVIGFIAFALSVASRLFMR